MPPKRRNSYPNIMDPVEKQYVKIHAEKPKKKCTCRKCICATICLGFIGGGGVLGYLYYNNDLNFMDLGL
jgi:hypothetical protein